MKVSVTFKTPDAVNDVIEEYAGIWTDEEEERLKKLVERFVKYGEYITVEFDGEEGTATVVPCK